MPFKLIFSVLCRTTQHSSPPGSGDVGKCYIRILQTKNLEKYFGQMPIRGNNITKWQFCQVNFFLIYSGQDNLYILYFFTFVLKIGSKYLGTLFSKHPSHNFGAVVQPCRIYIKSRAESTETVVFCTVNHSFYS